MNLLSQCCLNSSIICGILPAVLMGRKSCEFQDAKVFVFLYHISGFISCQRNKTIVKKAVVLSLDIDNSGDL